MEWSLGWSLEVVWVTSNFFGRSKGLQLHGALSEALLDQLLAAAAAA